MWFGTMKVYHVAEVMMTMTTRNTVLAKWRTMITTHTRVKYLLPFLLIRRIYVIHEEETAIVTMVNKGMIVDEENRGCLSEQKTKAAL